MCVCVWVGDIFHTGVNCEPVNPGPVQEAITSAAMCVFSAVVAATANGHKVFFCYHSDVGFLWFTVDFVIMNAVHELKWSS